MTIQYTVEPSEAGGRPADIPPAAAPALSPGARDLEPGAAAPNPCPAPGRESVALFAPAPGETPRAFSAFLAYFHLGDARSLPAVAQRLGLSRDAVKRWSAKYGWADRIHSYNTGLLRRRLEAEEAARHECMVDWVRRTTELREQEWRAARILRGAAHCFLESFGDRELAKMNLAQVARALQVSSQMARHALAATSAGREPQLAPIQLEIADALSKAYGQPPPTSTPDPGSQND